MLADELYNAMLEVGHTARRHKIPGPLAHTVIDVAQKSLELWRWDEKTAMRFNAGVLAGPSTSCCFATQLDSFLSLWLPHVGGSSGCWNTSQISMEVDRKLSARPASIYYSSRGYWKGTGDHQKSLGRSQDDRAAGPGLAQEASHLSDLSACSTAHTTAEI